MLKKDIFHEVYLQHCKSNLSYRRFFSMGPAKAANYCKQMQSNVLIHKAATAYQEALKDSTEYRNTSGEKHSLIPVKECVLTSRPFLKLYQQHL